MLRKLRALGKTIPNRKYWCLVVGILVGAMASAQEGVPPPSSGEKVLPINLASALQLANARSVDVAVAGERVRLAAAQYERAHVLWLPTIQFGGDYYRHDGRIQDTQGNILDSSKSSVMVGAAPNAVFALSDAIFEPLAARQNRLARESGLQAAVNDTALAVAETYFNVQQARGELAGALDAAKRMYILP